MKKTVLVCLVVIAALANATPTEKVIRALITGPLPEPDAFGCCSLACAVQWSVQSSSAHQPQSGLDYKASNLDDMQTDTAWVEGSPGDGVGETVSFIFNPELWPPPEATVDQVPLRGFTILNGYTKSKSLWKANSRVKMFRVYHNGVHAFDVSLEDSMDVQTVKFDPIWIKVKDVLKIEILSVYPGDQYHDTAITELTLDGAH